MLGVCHSRSTDEIQANLATLSTSLSTQYVNNSQSCHTRILCSFGILYNSQGKIGATNTLTVKLKTSTLK